MRIAELKDKLLSSKIVRFVLVGGCSTGIDFVIYVLLSMQIPITISKGISMISASVFSYFVNKQYTFANKEKTTLAYLIKLDHGLGENFSVIKEIAEQGEIITDIVTHFSALEMTDPSNFKSLLFYFGLLSIKGVDMV